MPGRFAGGLVRHSIPRKWQAPSGPARDSGLPCAKIQPRDIDGSVSPANLAGGSTAITSVEPLGGLTNLRYIDLTGDHVDELLQPMGKMEVEIHRPNGPPTGNEAGAPP
jgi:hypothetical protein